MLNRDTEYLTYLITAYNLIVFFVVLDSGVVHANRRHLFRAQG
jgi:hypothetical protein